VGPVDSTRWPFTSHISVVSSALLRSPVPGTALVTANLDGTLASPRVRTQADLDIDDLAALVSRDALHVEAHAELVPDTGSTLFGDVQLPANANAGLRADTMHRHRPARSRRNPQRLGLTRQIPQTQVAVTPPRRQALP